MNSNRTWAVLALIAVLSWVGVGLFAKNFNALGSQGAASVFASMVAAAVVSTLGSVLRIRRPSAATAEVAIPGLIRVVPKIDVSSDEWLSLLIDARHEFFLAGHTLGKWCGGTHRELFESNIIRILKGHGSVTLLTLGPGSPHLERLKQATERDYTKAVDESREFLRTLLPLLQPDQQLRLRISVLPAHAALPYTVVGNEHTLVTATYLSSRDRDEVPCLQIRRKSDAAISIYDDFCRLVKQGEEFVSA